MIFENIVRIWIGNPYENGNFNGTAFLINEHTLVTAKHVVTNRDNKVYENIFISNTPDGGITPITSVRLCDRDIAILKVKKSFNIEDILFDKNIQEGKEVNVIGFYDKDSSQKTYENRVSGYQSSEHTYELQNHLTKGLSGSPVFLDGKICGVAKAINTTKNITYIIPISELCMDVESFFVDKAIEKSPKKKISLEQMGIIATIVGVVISAVAILLPSKKENIPIVTVPIHTGSGTQINLHSKNEAPIMVNIDNNIEQYCQDRIFRKEKNVNRLVRELNTSTISEFRKNISFDLDEAKLQFKKVKEDCLNKK